MKPAVAPDALAFAGVDAVARWKTLSELSQAIGGYRSMDELFHDLADRLHDLLNFTYLSVVLHDPTLDRMRVWQIEGAAMPPYPERPGIRIEESPSGRVWQTQQPLVISDTHTPGDFRSIEEILARVNVRSFLSLPLTTVQRRLGALNLGNAQPRAYDGLDLQLPLLVASHTAVAVDNAMHADAARALEADLRERNAELAAERQRLAAIVDEIPGAVWELDGPAGAASSAFRFLNNGFETLLGIGRDALRSSPGRLLRAVNRADRPRLLSCLRETLRGMRQEPLVVQCHPKSGSARWVEIRCTPIGGVGAVTGVRGIALDVTSRIEFERERRRHVAQLVAERHQERARIAGELHDTLLQSAVSVSLRLDALAERVARQNTQVAADITASAELLEHTIVDARKAVQGLRVAESPEEIVHALQRTADRLRHEAPISCQIRHEGRVGMIDPVIVDGVTRITTEALTNAFRHSRGSHIDALVEYLGDQLRVTIRDNGAGIEPHIAVAGKAGHLGVVSMRERADVLGGSLMIRGSADGTTVQLVVRTTLDRA
ncbi:MAG TPA: GAF domain-containing protein [Gemmatimonadaceae bacterium]|nr:GAF domain-containing protein [Gemmatimonadaceae bacterium]